MEEQAKLELEILCDGQQPVNEQGDPIHNAITLCYGVQKMVPDKIKNKALKYIHYFIRCKGNGISLNNVITGTIWSTNHSKRSSLGRYIRKASRFTWEPSA